MNTYEEKIQARKERYEELAVKKSAEANSLYNQAHKMAECIPFGQPILIGHHSESRDRNYRAKISNKFDKAHDTYETSKYYEQKAASVGKGGISSDDPDAIEKLKEKLSSLENNQIIMKQANAIIRKYKTAPEKCLPELEKLGFKPEQATAILKPDFCGRIGFPSYSLQNNNGNINNVKERIAHLEKASVREDVKKEFDGFDYAEEDNRAQFIFPGKPSEEIRTILKYHSFKWSPNRGAWVRQLTGNGRYAAECVIKKLQEV